MKGHNLEVLGIQLTRHKDKANTIYTPQSKENVWLYAKMSVQSTDSAVSYYKGMITWSICTVILNVCLRKCVIEQEHSKRNHIAPYSA